MKPLQCAQIRILKTVVARNGRFARLFCVPRPKLTVAANFSGWFRISQQGMKRGGMTETESVQDYLMDGKLVGWFSRVCWLSQKDDKRVIRIDLVDNKWILAR